MAPIGASGRHGFERTVFFFRDRPNDAINDRLQRGNIVKSSWGDGLSKLLALVTSDDTQHVIDDEDTTAETTDDAQTQLVQFKPRPHSYTPMEEDCPEERRAFPLTGNTHPHGTEYNTLSTTANKIGSN